MTARFRQGAGRLSLDYVRTLRRRGKPGAVEELPDPEALAAWITECSPIPVSTLPTPEQVAVAQDLREAVYGLLTGSDGAAGRRLVNAAAARPTPAPELDSAGGLRWRADDTVEATLSLVARDAVDLVSSPAIHRVRPCADPDCSALFLDSSRPGRRRWCSMDTCGNRAKKESLRARTG
ncbi:CGNR zinc finger domain-containing protein [Fodinicola acaciae]|uniref:CGNR zinc finger domain-containing protein n=1 Tax=Fodinicola acaciae TaxID=2681555 RepID=UPI0013D426A8|nr:ABATE domain-containing protein [Fodinicola acaciae]